MTKLKKKGLEGVAAEYVTRNRALKKLQLTLSDFRRLCILKGIYPRDPKHKNKIGSTATNKKTVYLLKDIQFLSHEPLLVKFRELKAFHRRLKKYIGKQEWTKIKSLEKNMKPEINLDHLVRERYPSFADALMDLDDPLSMLALFSTLPKTTNDSFQENISGKCARLLREFEAYIIATNSLKKSFISIKGIYYQAEILGQLITWVVPHEFTTPIPSDVDFQVMLTFLKFYMTLMRFVNYRLFNRLGWAYPQNFIEDGQEVVIKSSLPPVVQPEEIFPDGDERLLDGAKVFISREVPRKCVSFVLQSMGAEVLFPLEDGGSIASEDDTFISHQIVDRPSINRMFVDRQYVQPQWVFDSLNAQELVDMSNYRVGATLPSHLSPFVKEESEDEDEAMMDENEDEGEEQINVPAEAPISKTTKNDKKAQKELAISMLSKKRQKLYHKMQHSRQKRADEKKKLSNKRKQLKGKDSGEK